MDTPARRSAFRALTPQLRTVLAHLLTGASEKEIASEMALSTHTVHDYVKSLYSRMGVNSRSRLFAALLVPSPEIFGASPVEGIGNVACGGDIGIRFDRSQVA